MSKLQTIAAAVFIGLLAFLIINTLAWILYFIFHH